MSAPCVSFLCPAYQVEAYIEEMIASLLAQDDPDWEAIFVDDGSTDRTADLVAEAALRDPRIRLVSRGIRLRKVAAFNLAFTESRGRLVALAGTDDIVLPRAVSLRRQALGAMPPTRRAVAFFRLRTTSSDGRYDGLDIPRGRGVSRSGGSLTMTRALAEIAFPIDPSLPAEDVWLGRAAEHLAEEVVAVPEPVLLYRIHEGNSNPRHQAFPAFTQSMHARQRAFRALLDCDRLPFSEASRAELADRAAAEMLRHDGRSVALLRSSLPLSERLALVSMATPAAFALRKRFARALTGRRGR